MSDFLRHLIGRELGDGARGESGLRPRLPSLFEREAAAEARIGDEALEAPPIEHETAPQPMPWRGLRRDASAPAPAPSPSISTQIQTPDAAPVRAGTPDAPPRPIDDASRAPLPAATAPQRATTVQSPAPGSVRQPIATPAPSRIESQRALETAARPPQPASAPTPQVEAPSPPRTAAFVPLAPPQPLPAAIPAQRTRIVVSDTEESATSKTARRAHDARDEGRTSAKPQAPARAPVSAHTAPPLRPLPAAQTHASAPPVDTANTVIQVSIGRIEVRAAPQTRANAGNANGGKREAPRPAALEDYLRERRGGRGT